MRELDAFKREYVVVGQRPLVNVEYGIVVGALVSVSGVEVYVVRLLLHNFLIKRKNAAS